MDHPSTPAEPPAAPAPAASRRRGPVTLLLDLLGSVWFGVFLLLMLFVYSSVGSAGLPIGSGMLEYPFVMRPDAWVSVREVFELSEFEWFHWWPFDVLIVLTCVSLTTVTVRRIPFNVLNLGVWMIHSGIIMLALGSFWYFGTKVEGDAPVARRRVVAKLPGQEPVSFIAVPGNRTQIGSYRLEIMDITPDWELLSGDDEGDRAYKVSVSVRGPEQEYIRELLAGYPQYTEDLVRSDDARQPFARAKKTLGTPLVDTTLDLSLEYDPQDSFYLMQSVAVYLRELGATEWVERPIRRLPRFKNHIASYDDVWTDSGADLPPLRPIDVAVPPAPDGDPMPDVTFRITDYLRYATLRSERVAGGPRLDPFVDVRLDDTSGRTQSFQLLALDPRANVVGGGELRFAWVTGVEQVEALKDVRPPTLHITVDEASVDVEVPITAVAGDDPAFPFTAIEGTEYSFRVQSAQDSLVIQDRTVSLAIVDIRRGETTFTRWVFDNPSLTRDLAAGEDLASHAQGALIDDRVQMSYRPGQRAGLTIVGGPQEDDLRLLLPLVTGLSEVPLAIGQAVEIQAGITMTVTRFAAMSHTAARPFVVPPAQRDSNIGVQASMVRLHVPVGASVQSEWLPFHVYPFSRPEDVLTRFPYGPTVIRLADGRRIEVLFSRERMKLPAPVVLDAFSLKTHIGGYAGNNLSVRDWTSSVRFAEPGGGWTEPVAVSVNAPKEHDGFWFFQSQWDPPTPPRGPGDRGSQGLNYTVLGVGNREGVLVQLAGSCLAVIGMIYAFYVKPAIKRRRRERVYATAALPRDPAGDAPLEETTS